MGAFAGLEILIMITGKITFTGNIIMRIYFTEAKKTNAMVGQRLNGSYLKSKSYLLKNKNRESNAEREVVST